MPEKRNGSWADADVTTVRLEVKGAHILAIDQQFARLELIEPRHDARYAAFPAPATPPALPSRLA